MDYTTYVPAVLGVAGMALQWLRQFPKLHDWWIGLFAVLLAVGAHLVARPLTADWRMEVLSGIVIVAGYTSTVLGGTFVAARSAAGGLAVIPRTNSA